MEVKEDALVESKWCEDVKVEVKEDAKVESKWWEDVKVEGDRYLLTVRSKAS